MILAGKLAAGLGNGAAAGFFGNVTKQIINRTTGESNQWDLRDLASNTLFTAGANSLIQGFVPNARITNLSAGTNSWYAVGKTAATKIENGTIANVSAQTVAKSVAGSQAADIFRTISGILSDISRTLTIYAANRGVSPSAR